MGVLMLCSPCPIFIYWGAHGGLNSVPPLPPLALQFHLGEAHGGPHCVPPPHGPIITYWGARGGLNALPPPPAAL